MLKSDEERGLVVGQAQPGDPVEQIAKKNRAFEAEQAKRERQAIAKEIIDQEKAAKVSAARNRLLEMLTEGGHEDTVKDFVDDLTADDRRELINSLKEPGDPGDEDELSPESRALVDDVMSKK